MVEITVHLLLTLIKLTIFGHGSGHRFCVKMYNWELAKQERVC